MKFIIILTFSFSCNCLLAQNIGIGTSAPNFKLHVVTSSSNTEIARFQSTGGSGMILAGNGSMFAEMGVNGTYGYCGTSSPQDFTLRTGGVNRLYLQQSTGNIGIGTNNPLSKFHVEGNTKLNGSVGIGTDNTTARLQLFESNENNHLAYFEADGGDRKITIDNGIKTGTFGVRESYSYFGSDDANDVALITGALPRLSIQHITGNVGIAEMNPQQKLHVNGNACVTGYLGAGVFSPAYALDIRTGNTNNIASFANTTMDNALIMVKNGSGIVDFGLNSAGGFVGTVNAGDFRIRTNYTVRMLVRNADGFVGIGTESPSQRLDVSGNINLSGNIIVEAPTNATLLNGWFVYDNLFGTPQFSKDKQGRVLLSGLAKHTPVIGGHVFTLPAGYRPEKSMYFLVASDHPNGFSKVLIDHTNGEVSIANTGSNITWVSFDNVTFRGN